MRSAFTTITIGLVLMAATAAEAARNGGNKTPKSGFAYAFESYNFQVADNGWPEFMTSTQQQGYIVTRYKNDTFDTDPEGATISNLVSAGHSGVLGLLYVHGGGTGCSLEVYSTALSRNNAFDAYVAAGWNPGGTAEIAKRDIDCSNTGTPRTCYVVRLQDTGWANRIKPQTDFWDTLVYLGGVCNSQGLLDDCGGRVRFGNSDTPSEWKKNLEELFGHMSGFKGNGNKRPAGDAHAAGAVEATFVMQGEGKTTLCPAVQKYGPTGDVACTQNRVCGKVVFDTESSDAYSATDIIKVSANATLTSAMWSVPKFEISFEIGNADPGDVIVVTVDEDEVVSRGNVTNLDGNQSPAGSDGKRPNEDDFKWQFRCTPSIPPATAGASGDCPTGPLCGDTICEGGEPAGCPSDCEPLPPVPAVSEWGLIVLTLLFLNAIAIKFGRRRRSPWVGGTD